MSRIGGKNFDISLGDLRVVISKATLAIEDNIEVAKDKGTPNGWVAGSVGAEGEIELDAQGMSIMAEVARNAGSWRNIPEFDMLFYAKAQSGEEMKVEAFGCKLKVEGLLEIDANESAGKHLTKVKFLVTSPDFVHINGVPYLDAADIEGIIRPSA